MIEPKENIKRLIRVSSDCVDRVGKVIRLDKNERTTPFPEIHFKRIINSISPEEVVAYPELEPFYQKLSKWLQVNRGQLLLTSGSDTGIKAVYEVYVDKGDEVIIFPPTYAMYAVYCQMFGGIKKEVVYNKDFSLPLDKVIGAINRKTKLIVIANPNHTGTALTQAYLVKVIKAAQDTGALVLIDEAYYHFYLQTMLSYIEEFNNLIIVRSFSKAFGIAGLRIGYLVANKKLINQFYKVKLTHEITSISAKFGEYLLEHPEVIRDYVKSVNESKKYLTKAFAEMGIVALASQTNFLLLQLPKNIDSKMIVTLLRNKEISISGPFNIEPVKGYIRITIGSVEQMQFFVLALKAALKETQNKDIEITEK